MNPTITRRELLINGGMGIAACALAPLASGAAPGSGPATTLNAAQAGTLTIGGDMTVNRLGFGALGIVNGTPGGTPKDPVEMRRVLRRVVELGVNLIDTADAYGPYLSEQLIHEALHPYPKDLIIATKGGLIRPGTDPQDMDGSPKHLREACEGSLKRLHLERIDLYQLHLPDPKVPLEESIGALAKLRSEGKIRHIGVSNLDLEQLTRARKIAPVVSIQNHYNVNDRTSDDVLRYCETEGLVFLPWGPLAAQRGGAPGAAATTQASDRLVAVKARYNISQQQVALAWLLARSKQLLPIPGTSSISHLEENVAAAAVRLTAADMAEIG